MKAKAILPGAVLGVLGGGQLGRMFALEARRMGYRVHVLSPERDSPTGQVADAETVADYEDLDAVRRFARETEAVTIEFENIPARTLEAVAEIVPTRPAAHVLHTTQHRVREKSFLTERGFPVTPFRHIAAREELREATAALGFPSVLKTAGWGYDGKGQRTIAAPEEIDAAFNALKGSEAILEKFVDFEREISVVAARGVDGLFVHYGAIENSHRRHILDYSIAPARVSTETEKEAIEISRGILEALEVVGVMCVEFFVARGGGLYVNELAPRPHNSGHLTIDACATSQFEQQLRALCALPLGSTERVCGGAAMANLLGDLWQNGEPCWKSVCALPGIKLHLYGKREARKGRKMGHLTALAPTPEEALNRIITARKALQPVKSEN
jgi:5-(carboxyamino)imidazole ribonucleotide synthase